MTTIAAPVTSSPKVIPLSEIHQRYGSALWRFPLSLLITTTVVLAALAVTSADQESRAISLIIVATACAGGVIVIHAASTAKLLGRNALAVLLGSYCCRLMVGVIHYIALLEPDYFGGASEFAYFHDFEWMHESLVFVSDHWRASGFLVAPPEAFFSNNKNAYLMMYNALLYFFSGNNILNLSPWNSLHHVYTAATVGLLALYLGRTRHESLLALTVVAFEPFGFISSIVWRDSVGQSLVALAAFLVIVSKKRGILWAVSVLVGALISYSMREAYFFVPIIGAVLILTGRLRTRTLFIGAALAFGLLLILTRSSAVSFARYDEGFSAPSMASLPLRFVRALVGPFPWFAILDKPNGWEYVVPDYFQHVLNAGLLVLAIRYRRTLEVRRAIAISIMAALLFFLGVVAPGTHTSYVSIGLALLVPIACRASKREWIATLSTTFAVYILANLSFGALGLYGAGILRAY